MRSKIILITMVLLVILGMVLAACGSKAKTTAAPSTGGSDGASLLQDRCTKCHNLDRVTSAHQTADQWNQTVSRMIQNGAKLTSAEQQVLVDYLAKTYGP
jgi:cytochrome c-type biogenesis protein CcmH/NrfF